MEAFAALDINSDGSLTREEYNRGRQPGDPAFDELDADEDGKISRDEYRKWYQRKHRTPPTWGPNLAPPVLPAPLLRGSDKPPRGMCGGILG
jgi:Ca2+-binding EF-hand superfamily protein